MKSIVPDVEARPPMNRTKPSPKRPSGQRQNLALGKPATQSSVSPWSAHKTVDKDASVANNGITDGIEAFHTAREAFPWWQVDLGGICNLSEVALFNRKNNAGRLRHFSILASIDGWQWVEIHRKTDDQVFGAAEATPYTAKLPEGIVGRFVRIQANTTDFLHFCECQVFGLKGGPQEQSALEARFRELVEAEERRMCDPAQLEHPKDIDIELALSQGLHPFPKHGLLRTWKRQWILDYVPPGTIGAEIGVFRGHFAEHILGKTKPKKLYLIDPWRKLGERFYIPGLYTNQQQLPTALARRDSEFRALKFPDTETVVVEDFFPDCASVIKEPLDWAYIDARHDYDSALTDIRASAKLLKPGGLLLGDDFWPRSTKSNTSGVGRAVYKFLSTEPFRVLGAGPQGQWCLEHVADDTPD
jgi:hypothetical protein